MQFADIMAEHGISNVYHDGKRAVIPHGELDFTWGDEFDAKWERLNNDKRLRVRTTEDATVIRPRKCD